MMHMTFHFGFHETVLFDKWHIMDAADLTYSVLGIIALAFLYEGLKGYRNHLYSETKRALKGQIKKSRWALMFSGVHSVQTILHALQLFLGYILMLIFMTYHVWLCFAVVIGGTLGYWVFSSRKINDDNNECCF